MTLWSLKEGKNMELNKYLSKPYGAETRQFKKDGGMVLSPSSISKFFENAHEWWLDRQGMPTFDGNTNTVLGNAVHAAIDAYYDGEEVTEEDVEQWIHVAYAAQMDCVVGKDKKTGKIITKVDPDEVLAHFTNMFNAWKAGYADMYPAPDKREHPVRMQVEDKMILAGTFDGYESDRRVLIDYKTSGKMVSSMSKAHKFQLTSYAVAMIADGLEVDSIRVVYIIKPTKTLPARTVIFEEELTEKMLMEQVLVMKNMQRSINAVRENPELADIVFRENLLSSWN